MLEVLRQLLLLHPNDNDDDDDDYYWQAVCIACRVHFVNLLTHRPLSSLLWPLSTFAAIILGWSVVYPPTFILPPVLPAVIMF